jgi:hypothetical protein
VFIAYLTVWWEILCEPLLLKGQFHGFTHQLNGQFQGIPLKKSQPAERTFARHAAPAERTFGPMEARSKPTFSLILRDLTKHPTPHAKMHNFRLADATQDAQNNCRSGSCCPTSQMREVGHPASLFPIGYSLLPVFIP